MTQLVLVHGAQSDGSVWENQSVDLGKDRPLYLPDLTAFASIEAMADDVLSHADDLFDLGGTSMGGYVCLAIMRKAPQRVRRLMLFNTSAHPDKEETKQHRQAQIDLGPIAYVEKRMSDDSFRPFLGTKAAADKDFIRRQREIAFQVGYNAFCRHMQACMNRVDSRPFLSQITCPTLIIGGAEDKIIPSPLQQEMAKAISGSHLEILSGAGHVAQAETPEHFNALVRTHLDQGF